MRVLWAAVCCLAIQAVSPADRIAGTWHGASLCTDRQLDRACRDEEVIYVIDSAVGPRGPVRWQADKIVNGVRELMGISTFTYDSAAKTWFWNRFTFAVGAGGDSLIGALRELPSHRLVRRIAVGRCTTRIPQCPR